MFCPFKLTACFQFISKISRTKFSIPLATKSDTKYPIEPLNNSRTP